MNADQNGIVVFVNGEIIALVRINNFKTQLNELCFQVGANIKSAVTNLVPPVVSVDPSVSLALNLK